MPQSEAVALQAEALTLAQKQQQNKQAAQVAAAIAIYYLQKVDPASPPSVQAWVDLATKLLIQASDRGAREAATFAGLLRRLEIPGATPFTPRPATGRVDEGVASPLLLKGPYDFMNKIAAVEPKEADAVRSAIKQETAEAVAAEAVRFAQMGARQTLFDVATEDAEALGWVRVTSVDPCYFCAMLASRGLQYRPFAEFSFDASNERFEDNKNFEGTANAKVHDGCRCSLKPVYFETDKRVKKTEEYAEMWSAFTTSDTSPKENINNFRVGYNHLMKTGEMLEIDEILKRRGKS